MRLDFIKRHRRGTYGTLLGLAKLNEHLHEIDIQASELLETLISNLAKKNGISEALKIANPLRWVQEMNNLKACAEEIVFREIVYQ